MHPENVHPDPRLRRSLRVPVNLQALSQRDRLISTNFAVNFPVN